ncbi:hypothetical protein [Sphingorhabdus sp. Alg231-15]|uniref:hypothetical protein n=1 Tax=Sphingorhabdus sp. Alg231-15 TaxID=1922222 RepID=UPI00307CAE4F
MKTGLKYCEERVLSPISWYCHRAPDGAFLDSTSPEELDPPMPSKVPGKGFPVWTLEHQGRELYFSSHFEIKQVVDLLGQKILPHNKTLTEGSGYSNQHWLSRLHKSWMPWKTRQRMVAKLEKLLPDS